MTVKQDTAKVLGTLYDLGHGASPQGEELSRLTDLPPERLNDAISILELSGYVRPLRTLGTAPFDFHQASLTPSGRYEWERAVAAAASDEQTGAEAARSGLPPNARPVVRESVQPSGSPYGFTDADWEAIDVERNSRNLIVVFGYQWTDSKFYEPERLLDQVEADFAKAMEASRASDALTLSFTRLEAAYGEHLFNQIARSIIAADIAVFDISDLNPNVMIEVGVALTWGTRMHPIIDTDSRDSALKALPTDISGQTWADYRDSGSIWIDLQHDAKMVELVRRAARLKVRRLEQITSAL